MKRFLAVAAFVLMFAGALPIGAQDQSSSDPYAPPAQAPGPDQDQSQPNDQQPGVARLSYVEGSVSTQRGDNSEWVAATVNTPIAVGDRVSTGQGGRAELQLDYADVLRLSDGATAKIANLSRESVQVQIGQGLVTYSVLKGAEATVEIDTPNASIHPSGPGEFRIRVSPDGDTEVVIREGSAEVTEPQGSAQVERGQMITIRGTDNPEYKIASAPPSDSWDTWNDERDHRISNADSWRKTDRYYTGSEDLDNYGTWSEVPDYGQVWTPNQGPGWVPYSSGRWVWEPYYGWTWVSYEPWGWAPYHYGRWFVWGGNWAWWPGPVVAYPAYYPVWAPAYVSFFGWGGGGWGFGVGFGFGWGFGHIGWLPCGPGDWYHPWWGRWGGRFNTFNVTNIHNTTIVNNYHNGFGPLGPRGEHSFSNVNEAFRNDRVRSGLVSMDSNRFGREGVSGHQQPMSESAFRQASMVSGKMPISPSRDSYSPTGRSANPSSFRNAPPASQHFFSSATRGNFATSAQGNRSLGSPNNTARVTNSPRANTSASVQSNRPGWQAFTPPQSGGGNRPSQGLSANDRSVPNESGRSTFTQPSRPSSGGPSSNGTQGSQAENRDSWQHFTPSARQPQAQEYGRGYSQHGQPQSSGFQPPTSSSRSGSSNSYSYARPPLNMRQPIVTPRGGSGGYYNASRGGYNAPRPSYSAPRPSYSAPRGGGGSHGGGGGGHSSGGHSGGGHGGGRSR